MSQQTAVEWLEQSIAKQSLLVFMHIQELGFFEQAKQLEKKQIIKAFNDLNDDVSAEQYYNENYNK